MSKIGTTIGEVYHMDQLANRDQWVNRIHPLVKFVITVLYIALVISFSKYDVIGLAGMAVYPLVLFLISELSFRDAIRRLRLILPLVCLIGIMNPIFDHNMLVIGDVRVSAGFLSMITLILKGFFTVLASYLLIATTTVEKICYALRLLHVPKVLVTQFLLTYRYITVLLGEANRMMQAYTLRAPNQKGVHYKAWGSLAGQLLLRSVDRANTVYESMLLRGYRGDFLYMKKKREWSRSDGYYLGIWVLVLVLIRQFPLLVLVGNLANGGMFG